MTQTTAKPTYIYYRWAFAVTAAGLVAGTALGWQATGTLQGAALAFFICAVLAILEISLSFDNAIVDATKLRTMSPVWQKRFLTWGFLIAVFGMRIIFPLLIVGIAAHVGPWAALNLALSQPDEYARIMTGAHLPIVAFGGSFLMLVGLSYFFDAEKDVHWLVFIESRLARSASLKGIEVGLALIATLTVSRLLGGAEGAVFLECAIWGILVFLAVELLGSLLDASEAALSGMAKGGLGTFLYLELIDASFSFDGVIGAFALSQNLFIIAIGLGIGAMYVRSTTMMLVEKGTLSQYRYLEHGAFYAILALSAIMFAQTLVHVPEAVTGLIGAVLIGLSLWSSLRWRKRNPDQGDLAV